MRRNKCIVGCSVLAAVGLAVAVPAARAAGGVCVDLNPVVLLGCDGTSSSPDTTQTQTQTQAQTQTQTQTPTQARSSSSAATVDATNGPFVQSPTEVQYEPGRLTVTFKRGTSQVAIKRLFAAAGVTLDLAVPQIRAYLVSVDPSRRAQALAALRGSTAVSSASREIVSGATDVDPNDTDWPEQWGLRLVGFPRVWTQTRGSSRLIVAVVDTGVDPAQPDLRGALVPGYDFANSDADPRDDHGHGTAVAGVIAARSDNREGVAGICSSCSIMPVKVLDSRGSGDDTVIAAGIVWAVDHGARVINLSLGGPGTTSELDGAVAYAVRKGAVVVGAAGNSGTSTPFYPAASPGAISVAATTVSDHGYPWSNFGSWVNVAAPGCNVAPVLSGGYGTFCGTSSATPVVAGLAALELSLNPTASSAAVTQALEGGAVPVPGLVRYGRIDAARTMSLIRPASTLATTVSHGVVGGKTPTRTYSFDVASGTVTAQLAFSRSKTLQLALLPDGSGTPLAQASGRGSVSITHDVSDGRVQLVVTGRGARTPYVLTVSYQRKATG